MFAAIKEAASQLAEKTEEGVGLLATHLSEEGHHKARLAREAAEIERRNEEACREGFARKRAVWFRDWKRDLGFYLDNQHSLIAAFRGHSLHPFSRAHRAAHVFCVLGLNIFLAALVAQRYPLMEDPNHYLAVALAAFLNLIYDQILRMLASAPCAEKGGCCDCFCCRDLCRGLGSISLYLALAASLAVGVVGCVLAYALPPSTRFFTIFWLVKGLAWGFELLTLLVSFYRKREAQRAFWEGTLEGDAYPYQGYPHVAYLVDRLHDSDADAAARRARERERAESDEARKSKTAYQKRAFRDEAARDDDLERGRRAPPENPFLASHDPLDELGSRRRVGGGFP
jgi:hypothetical protein